MFEIRRKVKIKGIVCTCVSTRITAMSSFVSGCFIMKGLFHIQIPFVKRVFTQNSYGILSLFY